jgi:hypothetical protein
MVTASWRVLSNTSFSGDEQATRALINSTKDSCATGSACDLQHQETRALVNQSYSNETRLEHQQTRALINATTPGSSLANFEFTWALVNQSYVNATQNATAHHAVMVASHAAQDAEHAAQDLSHPGGCASPCQGNITNNTLNAFTSDCHGTGTNLCVNGHVSMLTDEIATDLSVANFLLMVLWFLGFVWCAKNQWLLPAAFALVGTFIPLFVSGFSFTHKAAFILFVFTLVMQWAVDRFRLQDNQRRDADTGA